METKALSIVISLEGQDPVNYGSDTEKSFRKDYFSEHGNWKIAKSTIQKTKQKEASAKISSNCIRNAIFRSEQPYQTSHILANIKEFQNMLISSPSALVRGYLYAVGGGQNIKRKSPLMVTDALKERGSPLKVEVGLTSGARSDTSYYEQDRCGRITYKAKAALDLGELAFLSCDPVFDRPAFNPDNWSELKVLLERHFETEFPKEPQYYTKVSSQIPIGERGIVLPEPAVRKLISYTLQSIASIQILRAGSYAQAIKLKVYNIKASDMGLRFSGEADASWTLETVSPEMIQAFVDSLSLHTAYRESTSLEIDGGQAYERLLAENATSKEKKKADKKKQLEEKKRLAARAKEAGSLEAPTGEALQ